MDIYLVGGAVRDQLLGINVVEKDWVVVGATIEQMLKLGFRQVGKSFPVFIHPKTGEEYALARHESKYSPGYHGFKFNYSTRVSLLDDLRRRDLTINAMAMDSSGKLFDPFNGKKDLEKRVLKHVSSAFSEDPVRLLRVARFLSRFNKYGFKVSNDTKELLINMVRNNELKALIVERIWKEWQRALQEDSPEQFMYMLVETGAWRDIIIEFEPVLLWKYLITSVSSTKDPIIRFVAVMLDIVRNSKDIVLIKSFCNRLHLPTEYQYMVNITVKYLPILVNFDLLTADKALSLLQSVDYFRRPKYFEKLLEMYRLYAKIHDIEVNLIKKHIDCWTEICKLVKNIDIANLVKKGLKGQEIATAIYQLRLKYINQYLSTIS